MLMGMMVVGTSASYADVTSKHNVEAIEVAQAVGVMVGDANGNFNPDQKVTRNEMAVIMANLLDLKVDDFKNTKTGFTDVPAWAEAYVAACKADGIISGYSATYFGGSDTVTAAQAGLMMCKALGYFQYQGDFADDWKLAAVKQSSKIELYDGIDAGSDTALTRNEVAQLVLNALEATMVEPDGNGGTTIKGDGFEITTGNTKYVDRTTSKYDYTKVTGKTSDKNTLQLCEELFNEDLTKTTVANGDNYGRPASKWTYEKKEIGTYADEPDVVYTANVKSKDVYSDLGLNKTITANDITVYVNGVTGDSTKTTIDLTKTETKKYEGVRGGVLEVYLTDDDTKATFCYITNYIGVITDGDAKKDGDKGAYVYANSAEYFVKDATGYKDDDVVIVNLGKDTKVEAEIVGKPETVKGYASAISSDNDLTIAGTKYYMGKGNNAGFTQGDKDVVDGIAVNKFEADKDVSYVVYIDQYKNILAVVKDEDNSTDDVVYVYDVSVGSVLDGNKVKYAAVAKVVGMDGVVTEYTVSDTYTSDTKAEADSDYTAAKALEGKFGYLKYDKGDDEYTIEAIDTDDYSNVNKEVKTGEKLKDDDTKVALEKGQSTNYYLKNDTVYLFIELKDKNTADEDIDKVEVKVGGINYTTTDGYFVADGKNVKYVVFTDDSYTSDSDNVIYIEKDTTYNDVTEDDYYTFDAYFLGDKDSKEITVAKVDNADPTSSTKLGGFYKYSEKSDGSLKLTKISESYTTDKDSYFTTTITGVNDDNVEFTQDSALFTKNSVIVDLTDADKTSENAYERNVTTLAALDKVTDAKKDNSENAKYTVSAALFVNEDGEVENIFITKIALAQ